MIYVDLYEYDVFTNKALSTAAECILGIVVIYLPVKLSCFTTNNYKLEILFSDLHNGPRPRASQEAPATI